MSAMFACSPVRLPRNIDINEVLTAIMRDQRSWRPINVQVKFATSERVVELSFYLCTQKVAGFESGQVQDVVFLIMVDKYVKVTSVISYTVHHDTDLMLMMVMSFVALFNEAHSTEGLTTKFGYGSEKGLPNAMLTASGEGGKIQIAFDGMAWACTPLGSLPMNPTYLPAGSNAEKSLDDDFKAMSQAFRQVFDIVAPKESIVSSMDLVHYVMERVNDDRFTVLRGNLFPSAGGNYWRDCHGIMVRDGFIYVIMLVDNHPTNANVKVYYSDNRVCDYCVPMSSEEYREMVMHWIVLTGSRQQAPMYATHNIIGDVLQEDGSRKTQILASTFSDEKAAALLSFCQRFRDVEAVADMKSDGFPKRWTHQYTNWLIVQESSWSKHFVKVDLQGVGASYMYTGDSLRLREGDSKGCYHAEESSGDSRKKEAMLELCVAIMAERTVRANLPFDSGKYRFAGRGSLNAVAKVMNNAIRYAHDSGVNTGDVALIMRDAQEEVDKRIAECLVSKMKDAHKGVSPIRGGDTTIMGILRQVVLVGTYRVTIIGRDKFMTYDGDGPFYASPANLLPLAHDALMDDVREYVILSADLDYTPISAVSMSIDAIQGSWLDIAPEQRDVVTDQYMLYAGWTSAEFIEQDELRMMAKKAGLAVSIYGGKTGVQLSGQYTRPAEAFGARFSYMKMTQDGLVTIMSAPRFGSSIFRWVNAEGEFQHWGPNNEITKITIVDTEAMMRFLEPGSELETQFKRFTATETIRVDGDSFAVLGSFDFAMGWILAKHKDAVAVGTLHISGQTHDGVIRRGYYIVSFDGRDASAIKIVNAISPREASVVKELAIEYMRR